ncbi:hypothetical protein AaE_015669 [Aphanomyces astaci]|uniref:Reverse transcriptase Ty1/copia-type domain-containing protein n=1 Tax=Aphanomyces astaci TaxID=112090 RepID=A0A6A4YVA2_APHAT|nr:hypothetical protein AaE_015669 [Aphanomyces astaci]
MSQQAYVDAVLVKFKMVESNPVSTPEMHKLNLPYRELVGSLQYLVTCTRSDIANAVHNLSKYVSCYDESHWKQAKRVVRHLKGTKAASLKIDCTDQVGAFQVEALCDADFANGEDRKSSAALR